MAKRYLEQLNTLIEETKIKTECHSELVSKHFFNGAALYNEGDMCASLSPVGIAFKLSADEVETLINSGQAQALKYFPKGHVKKDYALFPDPDLTQAAHWKSYLLKAINQVL